MKYKFYGLPLHYGADSIGINYGIDELKKELQKKKADVIEKIEVANEQENGHLKYIKYLNSITKSCTTLAEKVNQTVKNDQIPRHYWRGS
jgi:hypothetical protein